MKIFPEHSDVLNLTIISSSFQKFQIFLSQLHFQFMQSCTEYGVAVHHILELASGVPHSIKDKGDLRSQ